MAEQDSSRKLTRADAVVIGVVCLLLTLLVPALFAAPREQSMRRLCAANLAQIGKAMFVYADDYAGKLPRAGGPTTSWGSTANWIAPDRRQAFGIAADGNGGGASINSSFYLLVKYLQMPPRVFVCRADKGATELRPAIREDGRPAFQFADVWDFGGSTESTRHCSYAYHMPYGLFGLSTSGDPNLAVAADRNPWIVSPAGKPGIFTEFVPDIPPYSEDTKGGPCAQCARNGNSPTHGRDGQNVLFLDGRVTFEIRAFCAVERDNIYTVSSDVARGNPLGVMPRVPSAYPMNRQDSLLLHDPDGPFQGPPSR
jgi:type II secretory pathway pseudopilin PulG